MPIKFSQHDLERKISSYSSEDSFKEEELFVWHELAGVLGQFEYILYFMNGIVDDGLRAAVRGVKEKRNLFHESFEEDRSKAAREYFSAFENLDDSIKNCLSKTNSRGISRAVNSVAEDIYSTFSGYLGVKSVFDLGKQLFSNCLRIRPILAEKGIDYTLRFPRNLKTRADYFIVVSNLVGNAVKYAFNGQEEKWIQVKGRSQPGGIFSVEVADNGYGIFNEDLPFIFDKYYSPRSISTSHGLGRGLGLYICKKTVEENGGEIQVKSKLGKGTTFGFTIPEDKLV